jgi:WhiB family transcriptional regulator, redox-sensing transcriptional regulator
VAAHHHFPRREPDRSDRDGVLIVADTRKLPRPVASAWEWQLHGACRDMDSAVFFHPDRERGPARTRRDAQAKRVCHRCPVIVQCREHALDVQEPFGVWGGLSAAERAVLLRDHQTTTA